MVFLPGALMTPQHMVDAGMFRAVRERGLNLDLLAVNLHALGDSNSEALRVLADEVITPARKQYEHVWLTGISRGGQLTLSCLAEHAATVGRRVSAGTLPGQPPDHQPHSQGRGARRLGAQRGANCRTPSSACGAG